jgi:hypothetical protein
VLVIREVSASVYREMKELSNEGPIFSRFLRLQACMQVNRDIRRGFDGIPIVLRYRRSCMRIIQDILGILEVATVSLYSTCNVAYSDVYSNELDMP